LHASAWLSRRAGADIRLKLETLQPTCSYKIRGAVNAALRLVESGGAIPSVVTASAGNHGRALAWAADSVGIPLTIYVSKDAPRTKLEAMRASRAELVLCASYDEAERQAKARAVDGGALYVSPYSHPDVVAGAGTVGLEIFEDWPDVDTVIVPVGGGGLISGIALACGAVSDRIAVVGVEVEASSPFTRSLAAGQIVEIDVGPTLADGLAGNLDPDTITFDVVRQHVARIVTIDEASLRDAIRGVVEHERLVAEGAGAAAVAAVLAEKLDVRGRRTAVVLSGGNIDLEVLASILQKRG
jgi:threonine dehydratase